MSWQCWQVQKVLMTRIAWVGSKNKALENIPNGTLTLEQNDNGLQEGNVVASEEQFPCFIGFSTMTTQLFRSLITKVHSKDKLFYMLR